MNADGQPEVREPFRVDLSGIVNVLSHHLYSSPTVFVRELLQNSVDAIEARILLQPKHVGKVCVEVDEATRTIIVTDNGVGLSREQIEEFVAQVGASSKRCLSPDDMDKFIGQFGIGLLSGFIVAEEILVLTRSVDECAPTLEWKAYADGTYTVREVEVELTVGTRVILRMREDAAEYADFDRLVGLARRYGRYLRHNITVERVKADKSNRRSGYRYTSNERGLWAVDGDVDDDLLDFVSRELGFRPLDAVAIVDEACGLQCVAYILPEAVGSSHYGAHKLYLKRMFVAETDVKLVPRWASFVRCVINSTRLRPTASRESVCEDEVFDETQKIIGQALGNYLRDLARNQRPLLTHILNIHDDSFRQLACEDETFFRLVIDLLPFETSIGTLRFGEYRAENTTVRLAPNLDQFRACASIAASQGMTIFNGGYTRHSELLERAVAIDPTLSLELVDARTLVEGFSHNKVAETPEIRRLLTVAEEVLEPLRCRPVLRGFDPNDIPAIFAEGSEQSLARSIGAAHEKSEGVWRNILQALDEKIAENDRGSFLCFNERCALVPQLGAMEDAELVKAIVRVFYVQALLLGRQPLMEAETRLLNASLAQIVAAMTREGTK